MRKINASDLAEIATCERRVYLRATLGHRETRQQAEAKARGNRMHEKAFLQRRPDDRAVDQRCFIATAVYGLDAPQTETLRGFRDRRMAASRVGRIAIRAYYRLSPAIAGWLDDSPRGRKLVRMVLNRVVDWIDGANRKEQP